MCPIDESLSEDDKALMASSLQEAYAAFDELSFCTVTFNTGNSYFTIKLSFTDMDNEDNVRALEDLDMITGDEGAGLVSMKQTEAGLIADGFIKR